jgi:hypothetical protein
MGKIVIGQKKSSSKQIRKLKNKSFSSVFKSEEITSPRPMLVDYSAYNNP